MAGVDGYLGEGGRGEGPGVQTLQPDGLGQTLALRLQPQRLGQVT